MRNKSIGIGILKSVIASITLSSVLAVSLPAFTMTAKADAAPFNYMITDYGNGPIVEDVSGGNGVPMGASGTLNAGSKLGINEYYVSMLSVDVRDGVATNAPYSYYDSFANCTDSGTLYTFASNANYTIENGVITFTMGDQVVVVNVSAKPVEVESNSDRQSRPLSAIELQQLEESRYYAKILEEKIQQAQIDNKYFSNLSEALSLGKRQVVMPGGAVIPTETDGCYLANNVPGLAITGVDATKATGSGKLYTRTWNVDAKKSPEAMATVDDAAEILGLTVGPAVQINVGRRTADGINFTDDGTTMNATFAVPKSFRVDGAEYGVLHVTAGGKYTYLANIDSRENIVTVPASMGEGVYVLVRK